MPCICSWRILFGCKWDEMAFHNSLVRFPCALLLRCTYSSVSFNLERRFLACFVFCDFGLDSGKWALVMWEHHHIHVHIHICVHIRYQVRELLSCETTESAKQKKLRKKIKRTRKNTRLFRDSNPGSDITMTIQWHYSDNTMTLQWRYKGEQGYPWTTEITRMFWPTAVDWHVCVEMRRPLRCRNNYCQKMENSTPRRETTRARVRPPPVESGEASKVRHDEAANQRRGGPHREQTRKRLKPGLKNTLGTLTQHLIIIASLYIVISRGIWSN